jgi:CHASE2 domain-containing sensor protein
MPEPDPTILTPEKKPDLPIPAPDKESEPPLLQVVRIITLLGVAIIGFHFEAIQNSMDWLHNLDVRSYNWISKLGVRKPRPQWTLGLEIDDDTFYSYLKQKRGDATNRSALAKLVRAATDADAAVIALDINLSRETLDEFEPRITQNQQLLDAIVEAEKHRIPVVLGFGFDTIGPDRYPQPNIFSTSVLPDFGREDLPYRVRIGFDEAPPDMRAVPLVVGGRDGPAGKQTEYASLSLQIVDAYEASLEIVPKTKNGLARQIAKHQFVYTSFLPQSQFPHVSAKDILTHQPGALEKLRHRIVIIGGNRHVTQGGGNWLDSGVISPMEMRGMYFHANRVEGLMDNRLSTPVSRWGAFFFDLILGGLMMYYAARSKNIVGRLRTLSVFFIPVTLAYIASVNLGYVLDFVAPLLLLLLHAFLDHYLGLELRARSKRRA